MASACFISRPVAAGSHMTPEQERILANLAPVNVRNNAVLTAILAARGRWAANPIVWVDNFPYKLKVVRETAGWVELLQMPVRVEYKTSGKEVYQVISKRLVRIVF